MTRAHDRIKLDEKKIFINLNGDDLKHRNIEFIRTSSTPDEVKIISYHQKADFKCIETSYYFEYKRDPECGESYCKREGPNGICYEYEYHYCNVQELHCDKRKLEIYEVESSLNLEFYSAKELTGDEELSYIVSINQLQNPHTSNPDRELVTIETPRGTSLIRTPKHYLYDSVLKYDVTAPSMEKMILRTTNTYNFRYFR